MIEFFVERVRGEKVRNGAFASKIGRGGLCGFSIHPVCQDGGAVGLWMDGSELFSASLPSPFRPRKYASGFRFDLGPELMLTHCKLKKRIFLRPASRNIYVANNSSVTQETAALFVCLYSFLPRFLPCCACVIALPRLSLPSLASRAKLSKQSESCREGKKGFLLRSRGLCLRLLSRSRARSPSSNF